MENKIKTYPVFCPKCNKAISKNDEIFIFDKGHCFDCELENEHKKQIEEIKNGKVQK